MALARKCDRCSELYEAYNEKNDKKHINGMILVNVDDERKYYGHGVRDLCPKCSEKLMRWFNKNEEF